MITRDNREGEGRMSKEQRQSVENLLRTTVVGREIDLAFWTGADSKTARQEAADCERDIAAYRAAIAILADEAEADRALGAKVRGALRAIGDLHGDYLTIDELATGAETRTSLAHEEVAGGKVLRAIADALREEPSCAD